MLAALDWLGLAVLLGQGLLLSWGALVVWLVWALTHPPRVGYGFAVARSLPGTPLEAPLSRPFESWTFTSRGRELPVWDVAGDAAAGPVVVVTHGWGSSRVRALNKLGAMLPHARRVLLWDMPGHGDAPGWSTLGAREPEDLLALIACACGSGGEGGGAERVVLVGASMGAGVSIVAAARDPRVCAVVAQSPYRFAPSPAARVLALRGLLVRWAFVPAVGVLGQVVGEGWGWWSERGGRAYDRAEHARRLRVPLLVLHAEKDAVVTAEDGRAVVDAAAQGAGAELVVVPGAGHNDVWTEPRAAAVAAQAVG
jgi:pimeloyl-ACP methyl ester carboxylesterase